MSWSQPTPSTDQPADQSSSTLTLAIPKANEADCLSWPCGYWPASRPQATGRGATGQSPTRHTGHCPLVNSSWAPRCAPGLPPHPLPPASALGPASWGPSLLADDEPTHPLPRQPPGSYNCFTPSCRCHSLHRGIWGSGRRQLRADGRLGGMDWPHNLVRGAPPPP